MRFQRNCDFLRQIHAFDQPLNIQNQFRFRSFVSNIEVGNLIGWQVEVGTRNRLPILLGVRFEPSFPVLFELTEFVTSKILQ